MTFVENFRVVLLESAGFWSEWSAWSACSKTCGAGGRRDRTRTCQGGATCVGSAREIEVCKVQDCPGANKETFDHFT